MSNITDYKIITISCAPKFFDKTNDSSDMEKTIQEHIKNGWQPFGNLNIGVAQGGSFLGTTNHIIYTQAMVRTDDKF